MVNNFKKWYKVLAIFCSLSLALVSGLALTACGPTESANTNDAESAGVNPTGFPITKEKIKMSMFAPSSGGISYKDLDSLKEYSKMTNIDFDYINVDLSDIQTKLNLALSSGEEADILFGLGSGALSKQSIVKYGSQGTLIPLENLIKNFAPNFNKIITDRPEVKKAITAPDGHIYTLPYLNSQDGASAGWVRGPLWYNGDWLKQLNISEDDLPKTVDEFKALLTKFKNTKLTDDQGTQIPMTDTYSSGDLSSRPWMMAAFGILSQDVQVGDDGKVFYAPIDDRYKDYLKFMNDLYSSGLLDHEIYSQQDNQKKAKGAANRLGIYPDWFPYFTSGKSEEQSTGYYMFRPLTSSDSPQAVVPMSSGIAQSAFAITKKCKNPIAAIRWIDYVYSQEGSMLFNNGPEGKLYKYETNSKGVKVPISLLADDADGEEIRSKVSPCYGIVCPGVEFLENSIFKKNELETATPGKLVGFGAWVKKETDRNIKPFGKVAFPDTFLTSDESADVAQVSADLLTTVQTEEAKFITGEYNIDSKWNEYVDKIKQIGSDKYVSVYQQAYDRYKNN